GDGGDQRDVLCRARRRLDGRGRAAVAPALSPERDDLRLLDAAREERVEPLEQLRARLALGVQVQALEAVEAEAATPLEQLGVIAPGGLPNPQRQVSAVGGELRRV